MISASKTKILFPLYIYPDPGAWEPLHAAIAANPSLDFAIIVNPNSGPGSPPWWPNADYVREIPRLNVQPNVRVVGYVRTTYCQRPIEEVFHDIAAYEDWPKSSESSGLSVEGIFFDETPNLYSEENKIYLDKISNRVKESSGILGDRLVIHNPGTAVDPRLADPGPDITAVAEEAYERYQTPDYQKWLATSPYDRARSSFMLHAVPADQVQSVTREMRNRAEYGFVTDLRQNFYQSFGPGWTDFVAAMAEE